MAKKPSKAARIKKLKGQKNSLYKNVNLKKLGAGKKRKPGEKKPAPPTDADFKRSAKTAKKRPTKKKGGATRKKKAGGYRRK